MLKHWKVGLVYAAFGSLFTIVGMLASDVTARRDKFGEIECTRLKIVDDDGVAKVALAVDGNTAGHISIYGTNGLPRVMLSSDGEGGIVSVSGNDNQAKVAIASNGAGGVIEVYNQNEDRAVLLDVEGEHSGRVEIYDKDKKQVVLVASGYIPPVAAARFMSRIKMEK